jgi:tRNA modification GTPase
MGSESMKSRAGESDTIVAVSTAIGLGAIGIVRLSGPAAVAFAEMVFVPARGLPIRPEESHCLLYGHVVDPVSACVVDEVLLAVMRSPRTYTREDVVEIHCHGGLAAQREVLRLLVTVGARLAEPGEFTRRAFLNGRIDLTQAESVATIVGARSSGALRASMRRLDGGLSEVLRTLRRELVGLLARIEATVDFSDEDVDEVDWGVIGEGLRATQDGLERLLSTAFLGRALDHGVRTAIVGRPNVGKSSLLNGLLMRERAIVSEAPGTTRDTVEEMLEIGGIPIHLVDTAGLRQGGDDLERLGMERSRKAMEQADLVLVVVDLGRDCEEGDRRLVENLDASRTIVVGNKADLLSSPGFGEVRVRQLAGLVGDGGTGWTGGRREAGEEPPRGRAESCVVSARTGEGLDGLRDLILRMIAGSEGLSLEEPLLANERQRALVERAARSVESAVRGVGAGIEEELVCEDLREAIGSLGRITGEELTPDLLDEIFSRFCLGK